MLHLLSLAIILVFNTSYTAKAQDSFELNDFPGEELHEESDFGPADFDGDVESGMPASYHDAWCKQLRKRCRVTFQGRSMTVNGYRGITREQLLGFRTSADRGEMYYYVRYRNSKGRTTNALFLFDNDLAGIEFGYALSRWYEQDPRPVPNLHFPNSQGPQDTHGRDGGMNPYDQIGE